MAQSNESSNYTMGHSKYATATHQMRTAESDAAFLLPHIEQHHQILDLGCGPGTITTGLAQRASAGLTIGVDLSAEVIAKAQAHAATTGVPSSGAGSVSFAVANVLDGLPYADDTFDVIFCSQVFGHLRPPDQPRQALVELRRVLKPGGVLATRDAVSQFFHPRSLNLDRLWGERLTRVLGHGAPLDQAPGASMPALMRSAGFDAEGDKVRVGAGTTCFAGADTRRWLKWRTTGHLKEGDPFYQSWLDAGISEQEIQETLTAVDKWAETEDAWFASLQCEMLAWK